MLFLLFLSILLSTSYVQTKLGNYVTQNINKTYNTNLKIGKVNLSFLGSIQLKEVEIRDHHKDTLIFVKKISTSILSARKTVNSQLLFDNITIENAYYYMKTYKGEATDNMGVFIDSFKSDKPKDSLVPPFILKASNIYVENLNFRITDLNKDRELRFSASNTGGNLQNLIVNGADFSSNIRGLYFKTNQGLKVSNLTTNYSYTKTAMNFKNTVLETKDSKVIGDIVFNYKREDLANFTDKVKITGNFDKSKLKVQDLKKFYNELSGEDIISFSGKIKGLLNDFTLKNLILSTQKGIKVNGDLAFKNAVNTERGFTFKGQLNNLTATYNELKNILPNVLGKTLPSEFRKLGQFIIKGNISITPDKMMAGIRVNSQIGGAV